MVKFLHLINLLNFVNGDITFWPVQLLLCILLFRAFPTFLSLKQRNKFPIVIFEYGEWRIWTRFNSDVDHL